MASAASGSGVASGGGVACTLQVTMQVGVRDASAALPFIFTPSFAQQQHQ